MNAYLRQGLVVFMVLAAMTHLAGCAMVRPVQPNPAVPLLRLAPSSLGCVWSAQQRIDIELPGQAVHSVEVLLEVDEQAVNMALVSLGQTLARLQWDGHKMVQAKVTWAPVGVSPERILSELQLAGWPLDVVRQSLPAGWALNEIPNGRELRQAGELQWRLNYGEQRQWTIDNPREAYRLKIVSLAHSVASAGRTFLPLVAPACS